MRTVRCSSRLPVGGVCPKGVSAQEGVCPGRGLSSEGGVCPGGCTPSPLRACENITFPLTYN